MLAAFAVIGEEVRCTAQCGAGTADGKFPRTRVVCHSTPNIKQLIPEPMPSIARRSPGWNERSASPKAIVVGKAADPVLPSHSTVE